IRAPAWGAIAAKYEYDAYGNNLLDATDPNESGPLAEENPWRFSTKYYDGENDDPATTANEGTYYYGYRYYLPRLGRWISKDPLEEAGGLLLYSFVGNEPIGLVDPLGLDWFENLSNFVAGVGDALSFGLTRLVRKGLNRMMYGEFDDPADPTSKAYIAGEVTEVVVEIAVTAGGSALRHAARRVIRRELEGGARNAFRRAIGKIRGGIVHHANPIKGHPNGSLARYPLPFRWAARGFWNMRYVPNRQVHMALHLRMMKLEALDRVREATILVRQAGNRIAWYLEAHFHCCWENVTVNVRFQGSRVTGGEGESATSYSVTAEYAETVGPSGEHTRE
ncbi:MAG: RHS repeat-associated core domain-containing protein, partial [Planctomycetota bacterium]